MVRLLALHGFGQNAELFVQKRAKDQAAHSDRLDEETHEIRIFVSWKTEKGSLMFPVASPMIPLFSVSSW